MKIKNVPQYIKIYLNEFLRKNIVMPKQRQRLKNTNFSVISSNCNGAVMCHDLGIQFNSPTVNLSMSAEDYLKFIKNLDYYLNEEIVEKKDTDLGYPIGILGNNIILHFIHYPSFESAVLKWTERKQRINKDNLFFMMTDRDGCTEDMIKEFDNLPYKNKLIFTAKPFPQYKSVIFCEEFKDDNCVPILTSWRNLKGERLYDRYIDFVTWLNNT